MTNFDVFITLFPLLFRLLSKEVYERRWFQWCRENTGRLSLKTYELTLIKEKVETL